MPQFQIVSTVDVSLERVSNDFGESLFKALQPTFPPNALINYDGDHIGGLVQIRLGIPPLSQMWVSEIVSKSSGDGYWQFVDEGTQLPFPLKSWRHIHRLEDKGDDATTIIDDITFSTNSVILDALLLPIMRKMFSSRKEGYRRYFETKS